MALGHITCSDMGNVGLPGLSRLVHSPCLDEVAISGTHDSGFGRVFDGSCDHCGPNQHVCLLDGVLRYVGFLYGFGSRGRCLVGLVQNFAIQSPKKPPPVLVMGVDLVDFCSDRAVGPYPIDGFVYGVRGKHTILIIL